MSHYIVMPLRPAYNVSADGSLEIIDKVARMCAKKYWTDGEEAERAAKALAEKHPNVQFGVFTPDVIYEALPPPPPPPPPPSKMLKKRFTDNGELVIDKGEE